MAECANDPGNARRQDTICHMCRELKSCGFCNLCCHWFCRECNPRVFARAMEAVKQFVGGPRPGCCGPEAVRITRQIDQALL